MSRTDVRRIGIVGLGSIGRQHARVLKTLPGVRLEWVIDINSEIASSVAAMYGCASYSAPSKATNVDGIVIATPTHTHLQIAVQLIGLANYLLVEKPLAATSHEHDVFEATVQHRFRDIQVGFIERFNPAIEIIKTEIQGQTIRAAEFRRINPASSRVTDVDVVTDLMIHDIDLANYLFGENGTVTSATCLGRPPFDYARASVLHQSGALSFLHTSRITPSRSREIQILTDEFLITCDLLARRIEITKSRGLDDSALRSFAIRTESRVIEVVPEEPLLKELQAFINLIDGERVAVPRSSDSKSAILIAEKITSWSVPPTTTA